eukprot:scaffold3070_cov200-Ochromonas_danica.AAC.3
MSDKNAAAHKQNMSGHITMNAQQAMFFQELNTKAHRYNIPPPPPHTLYHCPPPAHTWHIYGTPTSSTYASHASDTTTTTMTCYRIARMRATGVLSTKPSRNPLQAERSPRGEFKGFSFDPPPAEAPVERWKYPENDWGLMAKFSSQKAIFDAIYERERKKKEVDEHIRKIKDENMEKINHELQKQQDMFKAQKESQLAYEKQMKQYEDSLQHPQRFLRGSSSRSSPSVGGGGGAGGGGGGGGATTMTMINDFEIDDELDGDERRKREAAGVAASALHKKHHLSVDHFVDPNHDKVNRSSLQTLKQSTQRNLQLIEKELLRKKKLTDFKLSSIKTLQTNHPEVLVQVRSERALQYVNKLVEKGLLDDNGNSNNVSCCWSEEGRQSFVPAGIAKPRQHVAVVAAGSLMGGSSDGGGGRKSLQASGRSTLNKARGGGGGGGSGCDEELPLDVLQAELASTQQQIERQKLKIGLQGGRTRKHYEMTKKSLKPIA